MRLLNTKTFAFHEEFHGSQCPKYAILSHTWEEEEVTFQDWKRPDQRERLKGYSKVKSFCDLAANHYGLDYAWVDTCCIDKSSSADLSEAINSMYGYYRDANICIVYLADVSKAISSLKDPSVAQSRWFTRGWTLQELIAPRRVVFFGGGWNLLGLLAPGSRTDEEVDPMAKCTGIPHAILTHTAIPSKYTIATRMSWASRRKTTRIEDRAYCLLGLFDVSLPLIYGEGSKAFMRLQEEIIRRSVDHSIFAWNDTEVSGRLLADSPRRFEHALNRPIVPFSESLQAWGGAFSLDNLGLRLSLPLLECSQAEGGLTKAQVYNHGGIDKRLNQEHVIHSNDLATLDETMNASIQRKVTNSPAAKKYHAVLNCRYHNDPAPLGITVMKIGEDVVSRSEGGAIPLLLPTAVAHYEVCNNAFSHLSRLAIVTEARLVGRSHKEVILSREAISNERHIISGVQFWKLYLDLKMGESLEPIKRYEAVPEEVWSVDHNICLLTEQDALIVFRASWMEGFLGLWLSRSQGARAAADHIGIKLMVFRFPNRTQVGGYTVGLMLSTLTSAGRAQFRRYAADLEVDNAVTYYLRDIGLHLDFRLTSGTWMNATFANLAMHVSKSVALHRLSRGVDLPGLWVLGSNISIHRPMSFDSFDAESIAEKESTADSTKRDSLLSRRELSHRWSKLSFGSKREQAEHE